MDGISSNLATPNTAISKDSFIPGSIPISADVLIFDIFVLFRISSIRTGWYTPPPLIIRLQSEVEKLIIIPVTHLINPNNHLQVSWQGQSRLLSGNGFRVDNEIIFGATARVVDEFITLIQR